VTAANGRNGWAVAGIVYAIAVFAVGFALGTVRVLWLEPRAGQLLAVAVEAPIMLWVSWKVSRWCCSRYALRVAVVPRAAMGLTAFAALMLLELATSVFVFGNSWSGFLDSFKSAPALIGLAAQLAFAAIPAIQGLQAAGAARQGA
jgi:hypothetical protein